MVVLLCAGDLFAQSWSGVIDPKRAIDWTATNPGVVGGIPTNRTQCGSTIASYTGTAATINTQLQNAGCSGKYVLLSAGTFTISSTIDFNGSSNVTLRGAGPDSTFIIFTSGVSGGSCGGQGANICIYNNSFYSGSANVQPGGDHACDWTAGYALGTTSITLSNCGAGFVAPSIGDIIILDQLDDTTDNTARGSYVCQTGPGACGNDIPGGQGRNNRAQIQMVQITSKSGSGTGPFTMGITPGLYGANWNVGPDTKSPGMWWTGPQVHDDGVESLSIDMTASTAAKSAIYVNNGYNVWVKNVRTINANLNVLWCYGSSHVEFRDNYMFGAQGNGSQSYGFQGFLCGDPLVQNNISERLTTAFIFNSTYGGVVGYNFSISGNYNVAAWLIPSVQRHGAGTGFTLYEGNIGWGSQADNIHGTHLWDTDFRERLSGSQPGKTLQTNPIQLYTHARYYNAIGNVLGTAGYHTNYNHCYGSTAPCSTTDDGKGDLSIFNLGACGNGGAFALGTGDCPSPMTNDANVAASTMIWGNYDTVNNAVRFVASEVPSGIVAYPNPVPASNTLPASFYLIGMTQHGNCNTGLIWWKTPSGCPPMPPIGPDVTGGDITGVGGFAYKTPAARCWDSLSSIDTNYTSGNQATISTISESGTTITVTATASFPASFIVGGVIHLAGTTSSNYNGTKYSIVTISGAIITVTGASGLGAATGGTATANPVYLFNGAVCYLNDPANSIPAPAPVLAKLREEANENEANHLVVHSIRTYATRKCSGAYRDSQVDCLY